MKTMFLSIISVYLLLSAVSLMAQGDETAELLYAVKSGNHKKVKALVEGGADVNVTDQNGATPIMWAAYKNEMEIVKYLASKKAELCPKGVIFLDKEGSLYGSLLTIAAGENNLEMLKYFVEELKLDINRKEYNLKDSSESGWTALHWAALRGHTPFVE